MSANIGETIKTLRKERGITQESLAAHLGISTQSISKWETAISSPDISQLGPLAQFFHVSVDYLLGINPSELESQKTSYFEQSVKAGSSEWEAYTKLQMLINKYPFDTKLLTDSLNLGFRMICPEDPYFDPVHSERIFENSVRAGSLLLLYEHSIDNQQQIKRRLVQLYAAHRDFERAKALAESFPLSERLEAHAWILHYEGEYNKEITQYGTSLYYRLRDQLNECAYMCRACLASEAWTDAITICDSMFSLIQHLFSGSPLPALHWLDGGDLHQLAAKAYLGLGDKERAIKQLSAMVEFDINWIHTSLPPFQQRANPLIRDLWYVWYAHSNTLTEANIRKRLINKLKDPAFSELFDTPQYIELLDITQNYQVQGD
jgi:transcriptional regulator with XRE-family HTH domain